MSEDECNKYFTLLEQNEINMTEVYEKLSEKGSTDFKIGDVPVTYFIKKTTDDNTTGSLLLNFKSLQNAIEEVASLKYVEFRKDIPVFEV
jgi:hypothetical protein